MNEESKVETYYIVAVEKDGTVNVVECEDLSKDDAIEHANDNNDYEFEVIGIYEFEDDAKVKAYDASKAIRSYKGLQSIDVSLVDTAVLFSDIMDELKVAIKRTKKPGHSYVLAIPYQKIVVPTAWSLSVDNSLNPIYTNENKTIDIATAKGLSIYGYPVVYAPELECAVLRQDSF